MADTRRSESGKWRDDTRIWKIAADRALREVRADAMDALCEAAQVDTTLLERITAERLMRGLSAAAL